MKNTLVWKKFEIFWTEIFHFKRVKMSETPCMSNGLVLIDFIQVYIFILYNTYTLFKNGVFQFLTWVLNIKSVSLRDW